MAGARNGEPAYRRERAPDALEEGSERDTGPEDEGGNGAEGDDKPGSNLSKDRP
jgi:hypothetical protein